MKYSVKVLEYGLQLLPRPGRQPRHRAEHVPTQSGQDRSKGPHAGGGSARPFSLVVGKPKRLPPHIHTGPMGSDRRRVHRSMNRRDVAKSALAFAALAGAVAIWYRRRKGSHKSDSKVPTEQWARRMANAGIGYLENQLSANRTNRSLPLVGSLDTKESEAARAAIEATVERARPMFEQILYARFNSQYLEISSPQTIICTLPSIGIQPCTAHFV